MYNVVKHHTFKVVGIREIAPSGSRREAYVYGPETCPEDEDFSGWAERLLELPDMERVQVTVTARITYERER